MHEHICLYNNIKISSLRCSTLQASAKRASDQAFRLQQSVRQVRTEVLERLALKKCSIWFLLTLRGRTPECGWRWRSGTWCGCGAERSWRARETCSGCWRCSTAAWRAEGWTTCWRDGRSWRIEEEEFYLHASQIHLLSIRLFLIHKSIICSIEMDYSI